MPGRNGTQRRTAIDVVRHMPAICGICGLPIDRSLRYPHPASLTADHIRAIAVGGHPTHPLNLQPAHFVCNSSKGDGRRRRGGMRRSQEW